jgi:hypothetical protein
MIAIRFPRLAVVFVCLSLVSSAVEAAPILFTDRAAFTAIVQPDRAVVFGADSNDSHWLANFSVCSYTFDGLFNVAYDVSGIGLLGDTVGQGPYGGYGVSGQGFLQPVLAIGFDLVGLPTPPKHILDAHGNVISFDSSPQPAQFHFAGTTFQFAAGGAGLPQFFGVLFDAPVAGNIPGSATIDYCCGYGNLIGFNIQNLAAKSVPEPSTILLFSSGIIALWQGRRYASRRTRSAQ